MARKEGSSSYFFDWSREKYGLGAVETIRRERRTPHGFFAAFVRDHTVLQHHCTVNNKFSASDPKFTAAVRRYQRALEFYCAQHPVELDDIPPSSRSAPLSLADGTTEVSASVVAESSSIFAETSSVVAESSSVVAESLSITPWAKHCLPLERTGRQYNPHYANLVCIYKRRRQWGCGRPRKCNYAIPRIIHEVVRQYTV